MITSGLRPAPRPRARYPTFGPVVGADQVGVLPLDAALTAPKRGMRRWQRDDHAAVILMSSDTSKEWQ